MKVNAVKGWNRQMKKKLFVVCALGVTLMAASACSAAIQDTGNAEQADIGALKKVNIDSSYNGKEIIVPAGELLVINLESNPTTGFRWELSQPANKGVLALIQNEYQSDKPDKQDTPVAGAGGTEIWTFEAVSAGETTIAMEYSRPWEGGEKGVNTFNLKVIVK